MEKAEKRDRRNTLAGRTSEESSDSEDSKDEEVEGREVRTHECTAFDSLNLAQGTERQPANVEEPSSTSAPDMNHNLLESPNVIDETRDPLSCPTHRLSITQEDLSFATGKPLVEPV